MYMLVVLSHALAFSSLFLGSIFDLKTTEVPDSVSLVGVTGGVLLHFFASLEAGFSLSQLLNLSMMVSSPFSWIQALGDPLLWSLGVGIAFSIYGWGLYFLGMWGGADAFAMSVLGFAAPTGLTGFSVLHSVNMFLNILLAGFFYTMAYAVYKSWGKNVLSRTYSELKQKEARVSIEVVLAGAISSLGSITGSFNPLKYFMIFLSLIILYRYMKVIQEDVMSEEVSVSELEGGEVLESEELDDGRVRGVTEDEIEELESETVEVKEGVRFIPVFPLALLITDIVGGGLFLMTFLIS